MPAGCCGGNVRPTQERLFSSLSLVPFLGSQRNSDATKIAGAPAGQPLEKAVLRCGCMQSHTRGITLGSAGNMLPWKSGAV
jgi:hypothetical protein